MKNTVIRVIPEVPMDLTLAFLEGKPVANGRMMFSTVDGRSLFVPEPAGREIQRKLNDLRIQPGDHVLIRQSIGYPAGVRTVSWEVYRTAVIVGQQADGSFVVPSQPGKTATVAPVAVPASVSSAADPNNSGHDT